MNAAWDDALVRQYDACKRDRTVPSEFWHLYGNIGSLLLDEDAVLRVLAASSWADTKEDLQARCSEGRLGRRLFGHGLVHVLQAAVSDEMNKVLASLGPTSVVDTNLLVALRARALAACESLQHASDLPGRRMITVSYRGIPLQMRVQTLLDEFDMRASAWLKGWLTQEGLLPPFGAEADLVSRAFKVLPKCEERPRGGVGQLEVYSA